MKVPNQPRFPAKRVALIPGVPALLAKNASVADPIAPLRAACLSAVAWLTEPGVPIGVHCQRASLALAEQLIAEVGGVPEHPVQSTERATDAATLVIGNGSARRTEKAPGFFDPRAAAYDEALAAALISSDRAALSNLDLSLGVQLLADVEGLRWLGREAITAAHRSTVLYDDDPFGVQYWVITWGVSDGG